MLRRIKKKIKKRFITDIKIIVDLQNQWNLKWESKPYRKLKINVRLRCYTLVMDNDSSVLKNIIEHFSWGKFILKIDC